MFSNVKTGTRVLAGFSIALVVAVIVGVVGYRGVTTLSAHLNDIGLNSLPGVDALNQIGTGQVTTNYGLRGLMILRYKDAVRAKQFEYTATGLKIAEDAFAKYEPLHKSPEEDALWKAFQPLFYEWKKGVETMQNVAREKDRLLADGVKENDPRVLAADDRTFAAAVEVRTLMLRSMEELTRLTTLNKSLAENQVKKATADASSCVMTMFSTIGISAVGLLLLGVFIAASISKILNALIAESTRLSEAAVAGKLDVRGNTKLVSREFRPILDGVNVTLDAVIGPLNTAADCVDSIAKGNIPPMISDNYNGDFNQIKVNLNGCIAAINGMIAEAKTLAKAAAAGELDVRADENQYQGEYREIIRGMNMMLEGVVTPLDDISAAAQRMADKDFTKTIDRQYSGAYEHLRGNVNTMIMTMRAAIEQITESACQFAEGSRTIAESAQSLAQGAQMQSASVEEMSASTEQLSRSVNAVKESANESTEVAVRSSQLAEEGGYAVQKSIESMEEIRNSSQKIGEIIQVISEIAGQTNLLALNAAIEAARAGEHGMGFAVVADEVRKLAERSNQAAHEISMLIKESTQRVEEGARLSSQTGESLKQIIKAAQETASKISEIATATVEQAASTGETSKAIQMVAQVTEHTASGSEEMAASSEQLGAQAAALRELVSQFHVGTGK